MRDYGISSLRPAWAATAKARKNRTTDSRETYWDNFYVQSISEWMWWPGVPGPNRGPKAEIRKRLLNAMDDPEFRRYFYTVVVEIQKRIQELDSWGRILMAATDSKGRGAHGRDPLDDFRMYNKHHSLSRKTHR
jgi:hypothetical protein